VCLLTRKQGLQVNGHTLETTYSLTYEDYERKFHVPWYFSHRVDLHNELKRLALNGSDGFPGAKLHLAKPVVDVDCENGVLKFEDGSTVRKDVIVGADGVHVCANDIPSQKNKKSSQY
jgi:salicylate hydroxylase